MVSECCCSAKVDLGLKGGKWMIHPEMELVDEEDQTARILPIYNKTTEMTVAAMRRLVHGAVEMYADLVPTSIPPECSARLDLMDLSAALRYLHLPPADADLKPLNEVTSEAHRAVVFDELFYLQLGMALRRRSLVKEDGLSIVPGNALDPPARGLALSPDGCPGAGAGSHPARYGRPPSDEPPGPGRCRLGQDDGRPERRHGGRSTAVSRWPSWRRPNSWPNSTFRTLRPLADALQVSIALLTG